MTINILFAATAERWDDYCAPLTQALQDRGVTAHLATDIAPDLVDYIVYAPNSPVQDFRPYTRAKAVLNLWAGVESVVGNETLTIPLARMVDPGMTAAMTEWVTGHVLRHHLGMDAHIHNPAQEWAPAPPPLACERRVLILGLGELGQSAARTLCGLGFDVHGWSRSPKTLDGITTYHGPQGLEQALEQAEIAVLLLPNTRATDDLVNAKTLGQMPKGAVIINPGRGTLINDDDLIAALDSGQIAHATLDVFRIEPLPQDHPFWSHPRVTVTPHIAAETKAVTAARVIVENICRAEAGQPLVHLVDRDRGY
jgi:glyoxylate/hydroxypyruvate reductase A